MKIDFPYEDMFSSAEVGDRNLISIYSKNNAEAIEYEDIRESVLEALENPIGTDTLEALAKGRQNAVIVADDNPQTPVRIIVPLIASELEKAGIKDIAILTAGRILSESEKLKRYGKKLCAKYPVLDNTPDDPLTIRDLGYTELGTRLYINNYATDAQLLIAVGQIAPSNISGFTGGTETILPGIAGSETSSRLYWESGLAADEEILGAVNNPIREEMNQAAERAGLNFIVNAVINHSGDVVGIVAGHPVKAFEKGGELAKNVFGAYFHEHADIVIATSYPYDKDLWQASNALYAAGLMVKEGGIIVLVSPCFYGVSRNHKQVEEFGYHSETETINALNSGRMTDFAAFSHCLKMGRLLFDKASCIMVKNGIDRDTVIRLGFKYSATPQRAIDRALRLMGENARIAVLGQGGKTLPVYMHVSRF